MANSKGLGKGLSALFSDTVEEYEAALSDEGGVSEIEIDKVFPNSNQPRRTFDEEALNELTESIKVHGIITPIVVNRENGRYMIIAGERRYRAALRAGLKKVPAVIKDFNEKKIREIALIENLQREDLNAVEAAVGIKELMERYNLTQEMVSERISKSRSSIANLLRILSLPTETLELVKDNRLSVGHAKCLAALTDEGVINKLAKLSSDGKLSVRALEKKIEQDQKPKQEKKKDITLELRDLQYKLEAKLATKVSIVGNNDKGRIYIDYFTSDDLQRVYDIIRRI